jgi:PQQ enzyme repeat
VLCLPSFFSGLFSPARAQVNVTQHHNRYTRDGLYLDPAFTYSAVSNLTRYVNFNGAIDGNVYAQPLYLEGGPGGEAVVIAVTESNYVYALDAVSGNVVWRDNLGACVPLSDLPCGDINPLGITGTPVVDLTNRTLFVDAMTTPDGGTTKEHLIYSLNVDTGTTNAGWPVNVNAAAQFNGTAFTSSSQNERGALALLDGCVYVPYGGHWGDCSTYHGWIVGIQETNSANVLAWATSANGGGAWGVGGVASDDGTHPYIATGNTFNASTWGGGEAVLRFQPGPVFSGLTNDYWAPTNWPALDGEDWDLGSSGPLILDVPGATPSQLIFAFGKDGKAYLLNRTNLSGVSPAVATLSVGGMARNAAVTYQTSLGTYVALDTDGELVALRIGASNPPTISVAWSQSFNGQGSPFVTSTDGTNNVIVWVIGSEGDQKLHGYNGDTGAVIFNGGGTGDLMANTRRFNTGIVARGRIYIANDNQVYEFTVPVPPIVLGDWTVFPNGAFQFGFTNTPGLAFTVYGATNLALPFTNWTQLGAATEISPGQFQFTDESNASQERFYRVTSQ